MVIMFCSHNGTSFFEDERGRSVQHLRHSVAYIASLASCVIFYSGGATATAYAAICSSPRPSNIRPTVRTIILLEYERYSTERKVTLLSVIFIFSFLFSFFIFIFFIFLVICITFTSWRQIGRRFEKKH